VTGGVLLGECKQLEEGGKKPGEKNHYRRSKTQKKSMNNWELGGIKPVSEEGGNGGKVTRER